MMPTHPHAPTALDRLLAFPAEIQELTCKDVAEIMKPCSKATIERMAKTGQIGSVRLSGLGEERKRIFIPRTSVVRLMVRSACGDVRDTLIMEIQTKAPQYLPIALREITHGPHGYARSSNSAGKAGAASQLDLFHS